MPVFKSSAFSSVDQFEMALDDLTPSPPELAPPGPSESHRLMYHDDPQESDTEEPLPYPSTVWAAHGWRDRVAWVLHKLYTGPSVLRDPPPPRWTWLEPLEELPAKLQLRVPQSVRVAALALYLVAWYALVHTLMKPYLLIPLTYTKDGVEVPVPRILCLMQAFWWNGKNDQCGLNGEKCGATEPTEMIFACPALCDRGSWTYSSITVGDQDIHHRGFFIGGGLLPNGPAKQQDTAQPLLYDKPVDSQLTRPYRADLFPCGAAVHAGVILAFTGGCARIVYDGAQDEFPLALGRYHVLESVAFPSFFPALYVFRKMGVQLGGPCWDPRIPVTAINVLLTVPVVYLASGAVAFWVTCMMGFWTITMVIDPPIVVDSTNPELVALLVLLGFERLLPTCFVLYVMWHCACGYTMLPPPPEYKPLPLLRLVFWYPLFVVGMLNALTFDRLPVDRLTPEDLQKQPGALTAVLSIAAAITACVFIQAYKLWLSGKFVPYLAVYVGMIVGIWALALVPGLNLRIHHYILAILLLPGTRLRGFQALLFQGILLGLLLSGTARWGFALIVETHSALLRSDPDDRVVPPEFVGFNPAHGLVEWTVPVIPANLYSDDGEEGALLLPWNAYSLLINDVERYRGPSTNVSIGELVDGNRELKLMVAHALEHSPGPDGNITLFLRVALALQDHRKTTAYTNAGLLKWPSGEFHLPAHGFT